MPPSYRVSSSLLEILPSPQVASGSPPSPACFYFIYNIIAFLVVGDEAKGSPMLDGSFPVWAIDPGQQNTSKSTNGFCFLLCSKLPRSAHSPDCESYLMKSLVCESYLIKS